MLLNPSNEFTHYRSTNFDPLSELASIMRQQVRVWLGAGMAIIVGVSEDLAGPMENIQPDTQTKIKSAYWLCPTHYVKVPDQLM